MRYANIREGEEVRIICSTEADPSLVQAVCVASKESGSTVTVAYTSPPTIYFVEPPLSLGEAMCAADTVLDLGAFSWGHTIATAIARLEYCTKGIVFMSPSQRLNLEV